MKTTDSIWHRFMIVLLVVSVFFEGNAFSLIFLGLRVRSVQLFEVLFLGILGVLALLGKWRWRKSPLDYWLLAYLSVSFIATFNSQWQARSVKIFLLLCSLAFLYWLVYQLLRTVKDIFLAFYVFLAMGTLQILFGLYQVLAGALNHYRGWRLPIGHMGLVHREFINSVWGRPYGTQVEPDFYGAICMVFALIFIILAFSKNGTASKWFRVGALCSLLGLYFSFVRASWLVFLLILLILPFFTKKLPFFRFNWKPAVLIVISALGIHFLAVHQIPNFKEIHQFRFSTKAPLPAAGDNRGPGLGSQLTSQMPAARDNRGPGLDSQLTRQMPAARDNRGPGLDTQRTRQMPAAGGNRGPGLDSQPTRQMPAAGGNDGPGLDSQLNSQNIRLFFMRISLRTWSEHPIIGHGPGSFAYVFWRYAYGEAIARQRIAAGFFPETHSSIFFSILGDTGLLGIFIFLAMAAKFIFLCRAKLAGPSSMLAAPAFALAIGLVALFLSYLLTNGLWLPMTWVFLALAVASLRQFPAAGGDSIVDARGV